MFNFMHRCIIDSENVHYRINNCPDSEKTPSRKTLPGGEGAGISTNGKPKRMLRINSSKKMLFPVKMQARRFLAHNDDGQQCRLGALFPTRMTVSPGRPSSYLEKGSCVGIVGSSGC